MTAINTQLQSPAQPVRLAHNKKPRPPGFIDFRGLQDFVPFSERTLRHLIKSRVIPHIRVSGGRRLLFHAASVERALLRFEKGGIDE